MRVESLNPDDGIFETDAIDTRIARYLHGAAHSECAQSRVVENGGSTDIRDSDTSMVDHCGSQLRRPLLGVERTDLQPQIARVRK